MKKPLKLGFTDTNDQIARFFIAALSSKYEIELSDDPKYLIFGDTNFGQNNLRFDTNKTVKIFYTGENQRPWNYQCHFAASFDHLEDERFFRLPLYVIYDYDNMIKGVPFYATYYRRVEDIATKTGFCSFVQRNPNCQKRNEFFHKLSQYKKVDSGGPLFNNIGRVLEYGEEAMRAKIEWLRNYKFNMAFENSSYPGYATEKLYEAYMGGTIPIYWGSTTVEVDFNPKAFLNWHDYGNDEDFIKAIIEVDQDEERYKEMYMQPLFVKATNRFMKINRFVEWFDKNVYRG